MRKLFPLTLVIVIILQACQGELKEDKYLLVNMMKREPRQFQFYIDHKDSLEIQIIYTQINRDANNRPIFRSFYFNVDSTRYFYPASTVKLPMLLLALEKIKQLHIRGLDKFTPMYNDSLYSGQLSAEEDTTSLSCFPSVAHYAKKILVVSDNDAHNRLYEFLGQKATNEILHEKGYNIRILHRLERPLTPDQNRHTEAIRFMRNDTLIYSQPMGVGDSIVVGQKVLKGIGYIRKDSLVCKPFDFSYKNFYPLTEQQHVLRALIFPESVDPKKKFDITEEDRKFVLQYMSQLPTETFSPPYAKDTVYYPAFAKYLMFGDDRRPLPSNIRIFNKIGEAYGYLIDNAYIVDFESGVEFMLSTVIATNTDGIYNDDNYELTTLGFPFMKNLGQLIYRYELTRKRPRKPDLKEFKFKYDFETQ
jgi:hypothetical protein